MTIAHHFLSLGITEMWSTAGCFQLAAAAACFRTELDGIAVRLSEHRNFGSTSRFVKAKRSVFLGSQTVRAGDLANRPVSSLVAECALVGANRSLVHVGVVVEDWDSGAEEEEHNCGKRTEDIWSMDMAQPDGWVGRGVDFFQRHT